MNWYKDYGITVIKSMKSGEAYYNNTVGDFKIDDDWGGAKELKDHYKVLRHKTFGFLLTLPIDKIVLERCLENIEKLYLLHKLGTFLFLDTFLFKSYLLNFFTSQAVGVKKFYEVKKFIRPEGCEIKKATHELIEDMAELNLDKELKKATKGKKIYFFERLKWEIVQRQTFNPGDAIIKVRSRFNFLVLDKDTT